MNKKLLTAILKYASLSDDLKTKDYKVLLYLIPRLRNGDYIRINHGKIADDLEVAKTDVSRSIRKLIDNEIIEPFNLGPGWKIDIRMHPHTYDNITELILEKLYENEDEDEDEDD